MHSKPSWHFDGTHPTSKGSCQFHTFQGQGFGVTPSGWAEVWPLRDLGWLGVQPHGEGLREGPEIRETGLCKARVMDF